LIFYILKGAVGGGMAVQDVVAKKWEEGYRKTFGRRDMD
jgi:hypothetical protein